MPFFVPESELQGLRAQNDHMRAELEGFAEMAPLLRLAEEVRTEIVAVLEVETSLDAREISERAYMRVLSRHMDEARDEVAARYEQEHRRSLYERLLGEVATTEGGAIAEQVKQKVETDPELALELQRSARKELAARATDVVRSQITAEQEAIIDQEAERQIALDRLDVQLALDRELHLKSEEVTKLLRPGDKVELFYEMEKNRRGRVLLTWTKDVKGKEGWVYASCSEQLVEPTGYSTYEPDTDRFVQIGCVNKDLDDGKDVAELNKLVVGRQVAFMQKRPNGTVKTQKLTYRDRYGYSGSTVQPLVLLGTDFQTKDIVFTNASGLSAG